MKSLKPSLEAHFHSAFYHHQPEDMEFVIGDENELEMFKSD
jgi:hypothetical protein